MATVTHAEASPEGLLTIEDRPMPELVAGDLLEREMGQKSDSIAATILILIGIYVRKHGLGLCNGGQGSYQIFPDDPRMIRIPDVSFTRKDRLPEEGPSWGHSRVAPDLVVEVVSPNDLAEPLQRKIDDYLTVGIPLVWAVYPECRTVLVHRPDGSANRLRVGDQLDGEDVVPGFRCEVAALFE